MTNESKSARSFFEEIDQMFTEGKGASMQNTAFADRLDRSPSADFGALLDQIFGGNPPKVDAAPSNDMDDAEDIQNAAAFIDLMAALLGVPPVSPAAAPFAMVPFAKLFNTRFGQLLVTLNNPTPEIDGPHIVIRGAGPREYTPEFVITYTNTDAGWLSAVAAFDAFSQEVADGAAADLSIRGKEAYADQIVAAMAASAAAGMADSTKHGAA